MRDHSVDLARALAADGYDTIAVDPDAPAGAIFRRTTLEGFVDEGPFDAAIASLALAFRLRFVNYLPQAGHTAIPEELKVLKASGGEGLFPLRDVRTRFGNYLSQAGDSTTGKAAEMSVGDARSTHDGQDFGEPRSQRLEPLRRPAQRDDPISS